MSDGGRRQDCSSQSLSFRPSQKSLSEMYNILGLHHHSEATVHDLPNFNVKDDCGRLNAVLKAKDNNKIIDILCHLSLKQRLQLKESYKALYRKELIDDVKAATSGDFEALLVALLMGSLEYDAYCLHNAMSGIGTREHILTEIICTRSNHTLKNLKDVYKSMYNKDLAKEVASETSGLYKTALLQCLEGKRGELSKEKRHAYNHRGLEAVVDRAKARKDAEDLAKAGIKKLGTDENVFLNFVLYQDPCQLFATIDEYKKLTKVDIFDSIDSELSGDLAQAIKTILRSQIHEPAYFAILLYESMAGLGTREATLTRVIVTRSEIDLQDIKKEYFKRSHGRSLRSFIEGDTSGPYKDALLVLLGP